MKRLRAWSYWIAWLALAVNGPRYVLVYLGMDALALPRAVEMWMLIVTGIATAVVLTGGNIVIASMIAKTTSKSTKLFLGVAWVLQLVFAVILIAPTLVLGVRSTPLTEVITGFWQWVWAITAVGAVELIAGATMGGYIATGYQAKASSSEVGSRWLDLAYKAVSNRLDGGLQPADQPASEATKPVDEMLECPYCHESGFVSRFQWGGHKARCSLNPNNRSNSQRQEVLP